MRVLRCVPSRISLIPTRTRHPSTNLWFGSTRATTFIQRNFCDALERTQNSNKTDDHDAAPAGAAALAALIYPNAITSSHHDLSSFLKYTEQSGLHKESTLFVGTHFEYTVENVLRSYGFSLRRVGGASDSGIDLLGTWCLPSAFSDGGKEQQPLKVLLQCKASKRPGPHLIRELEGTFVGAPAGWRGSRVMGFLVTDRPATKGIRDALGRSRWPMGFISCSRTGLVQQILWNRRAEEEGLEGLGIGVRHSQSSAQEGVPAEQKLLLTFNGNHQPMA
ncbi:hypothetical protein B0H63DRAFT_117256 [Podospora didyma]|uniref:Required for respiratory growth protein 7, mitochondrial n=1 Tax=Podospora didyma TaxID=330526 RepID=A0AAE0NZJ8_9PEZI|nr:hypothetical protein B0H63DRAFT_117256 [Podospora didyma]